MQLAKTTSDSNKAPSMLSTQSYIAGQIPAHRRRRDGCTECRRKKIRCDLQKPVCTRCKRYPRGCIYDLSIVPHTPRAPRRRRVDGRRRTSTGPEHVYSSSREHVAAVIHQPCINPSPFLFSTDSRFYMHVFSTQTAPMLFPAAPDFFLQRMISAALDTPHLLYALLAAACSHHSRLVRDKSCESQTMCLMFTNRAISSLRAALCEDQEAIKPETVTAAMALCTNDVCNGNMPAWRTHLRGVLRLLTALVDRQKEPGLVDPFTQALLKWFTTLDLLAGLSGLRAECVHDARDGMLGQFWKGAEGRVDDICGYSLDLVPILGRASQLIHQQHLYPLVGDESNIHDSEERQQVTREAETLEKQILSLLDNTTPDSILDHSNHLHTELQYTNRAFAYSALLHLHRRVQQLQQNHPKVREEIIGILDAVANIRPFSSANILILWPIFSAGCETETQSERELIQTRMGNMQSLGMGNFSRSRKLLYQFWQSGSSLPWDIYFARLGLELVLF